MSAGHELVRENFEDLTVEQVLFYFSIITFLGGGGFASGRRECNIHTRVGNFFSKNDIIHVICYYLLKDIYITAALCLRARRKISEGFPLIFDILV